MCSYVSYVVYYKYMVSPFVFKNMYHNLKFKKKFVLCQQKLTNDTEYQFHPLP
jgi:hypothetical protein